MSASAEFATIAEAFCTVVEQHAELGARAFLTRLHPILAAAYRAGLSLDPLDWGSGPDDEIVEDDEEDFSRESPPDPDRGSHDEWDSLYRALSDKLGEMDRYRMIFDPYEPLTKPELRGSLADDIADLYRDLDSGRRKWRRGEHEAAATTWRTHFELHWGPHALWALGALHSLAIAEKIEWSRDLPRA